VASMQDSKGNNNMIGPPRSHADNCVPHVHALPVPSLYRHNWLVAGASLRHWNFTTSSPPVLQPPMTSIHLKNHPIHPVFATALQLSVLLPILLTPTIPLFLVCLFGYCCPSESAMLIQGEKWACRACVRGDRANSCQHSGTSLSASAFRPLCMVRG
jgi:hypothetical protein